MSNVRNLNLGTAMLQRGKSPVQQSDSAASPHVPVSEMAMVLTLDQLRPNPDNPRNARNPRYEDIKASVRARGLDSVPKVTLDPDGDGIYIFSDGGNTRYQILCELWQETGEDRFYRVHTIFKPWPGRLKCLIGHLAENEVRGDLIFIDKAFGVHKARVIYEEQLGRSVTLRELSDLLGKEGYPIDNSSVSRMEDTLNYIYPYMPRMLESGMSRGQVMHLLSLRSSALKVWKSFSGGVNPSVTLDEVFGETCRVFDEPDSYSLEVFRDEFIGKLVKALPHPSLNYDRWLIELDPKEQKRREQFGDPPAMPLLTLTRLSESSSRKTPPVTVLPSDPTAVTPSNGLRAGTLVGSTRPEPAPEPVGKMVLPESHGISNGSILRKEIQNDLIGGGTVITGDGVSTNSEDGADLFSLSSHSLVSAFGEQDDTVPVSAGSVSFAETGLEPVSDIWLIPALQDDVEHLQDMAYRLVYEIAEGIGCESGIDEDKSPTSAGFSVSGRSDEFSLFLACLSGRLPNQQCNMYMFCQNFFGSQEPADTPVFDDVMVVKMMRLIRIIRRLRELQRLAAKGGENV
ncbi:ParB family protein [Pantoea ananatis]|uniref:ParB family protein n=1 Tax=Pantoea ananas TaxID=553 RepID=UPI00158A6B83|nr:ParB family protein [Pantoea ananatis]MBA4823470.1 ParB family protein [Pantoea ananatis]QKV88025.1 ParB family protein [Pantoea ananatis]